jgi:hypothetical protein
MEFRMKKNEMMKIIRIFCVVIALASCASSSKNVPTGSIPGTGSIPETGGEAPTSVVNVERIRVDYQGAVTGAEIPAWVQAVIDADLIALQKLPGLEDKVAIVDYGIGQNLDLLRSQVNNFNIQASVARRISNYVEANFGGEQLGDKNSAENRDFVEEVVAAFSRVEINGLARVEDYWIKLRTIDRGKKTESEQYYYYVFYSISGQDLNEQIARAMNSVSAKTRDQEEIRADVEDAIVSRTLHSVDANG